MSSRPPFMMRCLAGWLLPRRHREFVVGDLEEMYGRRLARQGRGIAMLRYVLDAVASAFAGLRSRRRGRRIGGSSYKMPVHVPPSSGWIWDVSADLRFALRSMRRERAFVTLAVLTLALGVGSSAAVFGMVDQILLRPLPGVGNGSEAAYLQFRSVKEPERTQGKPLATLDFDELRRSATLLEGVASFGNVSLKVGVGDARPVRVAGNTVYGDFFEVLRAWPAAGRLLSASETALGADPMKAVISESLAGQLFGSVAGAVGKTVRMNEQPVTVIGVAGGGFAGAERGIQNDVWLPFGALVPLVGFTPGILVSRDDVLHGDIIIRPKPGVSTDAVQAQVGEGLRRLVEAGSESSPYLADLQPSIFRGLHTPPIVREATNRSLRMLAIVVGLVLLIACANVANLLLFRNVRRRGATATLRALGASTGRIARQQIVLSSLLALFGTVAGVGVGWLIALPFRGASLMRMPAFDGLTLDMRVALFAGMASLVTAVVFGAVPALLAGRFDLAGSLRSSSGRDTGRLAQVRSALSAVQFSIGLALVVGALLLLRTMGNLRSVDLGLDVTDVVAVTVEPPRDIDAADQEVLYRNLISAVQALPEVKGVAGDPYGPFGPSFIGRIRLPDVPDDQRLSANMLPVTPGWFELLRASVVSGRTFRDADWRPGSPAPIILTESLARRLFGRSDVVGRTVEAGFGRGAPMEVIGVVGDLRSPQAPDGPEDAFFVTPSAGPSGLPFFTLLLRVSPFDQDVARRIRALVEAALPGEAVPDPVSLSDRLDEIHSEARIYSRLLGLLSILAVILSAVGLYGVVAFTVAARRREFGVRLALGAEAGRIAQLVARDAAVIVVSGTVIGLGGAYALSRLLQNRLFGVEPLDPASFASAAAIFVAVAAVACWVPTLRAVRVDPVATLREE